jgi:hypothetical protein
VIGGFEGLGGWKLLGRGRSMDNSKKSASDASVGPVELIFASVVVAIWLAAFAFGYWEGRDIGSMLFSQNVGT